MIRQIFAFIGIFGIIASVGAAQTRPARVAKVRGDTPAEIVQMLASPDTDTRQQAVEAMRARLATPRGLQELRNSGLLRQLGNTTAHKEILELSTDFISATSGETRMLEILLQMRIKAELALGKPDEALADAKSLFNVASMTGTSEAILAVAQCLNAAKPNEPATFNKFRDEQMSGATTQPAFNTDAAVARKSTVLLGIKVDPKLYADMARKITGEDASSLLARGNLLLMADDLKGAREVFERLYSLASSDLNESSEALARLMKAEDGTIGRANTFILSIRPKGK